MLRLLQLLLVLILLAAATVLGPLVLHVCWADLAALKHRRRDPGYGWLLIQAAWRWRARSAGCCSGSKCVRIRLLPTRCGSPLEG